MRILAALVLLIGLGLAGASVFVMSERFDALERVARAQANLPPPPPKIETQKVVIAARPLKYGNMLRADMLKVVEWPVASAPKGGFADIASLMGDGSEPRTVIRPMAVDEPVVKTRITGFGERATISSRLDLSKRAYTIRINDVSGVAGFLLPGDRVDILLTRTLTDGKERVTDVILQNINVIGIDQLSDEEQNSPVVGRSATVEASPEEAQKLALASSVGTLSLSLRGIGSDDTVAPKRIRTSDLLKEKEEIKTKPARVIRVRRGREVEKLTVAQ